MEQLTSKQLLQTREEQYAPRSFRWANRKAHNLGWYKRGEIKTSSGFRAEKKGNG